MYAIIADGGRQYQVEEGQALDIDYRQSLQKGDELTFSEVLAISGDEGLEVGSPAVPHARVTAKVLGVARGDKIYIQKLRRRKNYRRRTGHRQLYTRIQIDKIERGAE